MKPLAGKICIVAGAVFSVIGGVGLLRLPDFFSRMHAGSVTDSGHSLLSRYSPSRLARVATA